MTSTLTRKWAAAGLMAAALAAATAWVVLTQAIDTASQPTTAPITTKLSASERAYLSGLASLERTSMTPTISNDRSPLRWTTSGGPARRCRESRFETQGVARQLSGSPISWIATARITASIALGV